MRYTTLVQSADTLGSFAILTLQMKTFTFTDQPITFPIHNLLKLVSHHLELLAFISFLPDSCNNCLKKL